jgi:hypothetical protein
MHDVGRLLRADRGPAPDGDEQHVRPANRRRLLAPQRSLPEVPGRQTRIPSSSRTKIVSCPRSVPAARSCSDAIPTTSATSDSNLPAVARVYANSSLCRGASPAHERARPEERGSVVRPR